MACRPPSTWRPVLYRHLLAIANRWRAQMDMQPALPASFEAFGQLGHQRGQMHPQSHLLHVAQAGHAPLRSYSEGAAVFPLQLVLLLSRPGQDFEGGEFVMTEQRPRMQSRPMVLPLGLGMRPSSPRGRARCAVRQAFTACICGMPSAAFTVASGWVWSCCCTTRRRLPTRAAGYNAAPAKASVQQVSTCQPWG